MAQWSRSDKTIYAKLVYYGPAYGGKTTNLESLHRLTDPGGLSQLVSVKTTEDRTLFFDVLPMDLGDILGYRVAIKVYTVPGQVRYDATRRVVLAGTDAVVFVADSSASGKSDNQWSLKNLARNMKANRLDPKDLPVLHQFNKQDLPDASPPEVVARWLGIDPDDGFEAVANVGAGVLETFIAASCKMMRRLVSLADPTTRRALDVEEMTEQIARSFEPHLVRAREGSGNGEREEPRRASRTSIVLDGDDRQQLSVEATVHLGEQLAGAATRALRLEREAEALRQMSELLARTGATFDRETLVDASLSAAKEVLELAAVSLVTDSAGIPFQECTLGRTSDPLMAEPASREVLLQLIGSRVPCVIDDPVGKQSIGGETGDLSGLRAVAAIPVGSNSRLTLLAYLDGNDRVFNEQDVRFLVALGRHLAVGLEKTALYEELARHRDSLEDLVNERTGQLRAAYENVRSVEQMKDRFLAGLSHEMKTPLSGILGASAYLKDYQGSDEARAEMLDSISAAGRKLQSMLENLFRVIRLDSGADPPDLQSTEAASLAAEATELAGHDGVALDLKEPGPWKADGHRLARAVANLLDNAVKFSGPGAPIELRIAGSEAVVRGERVPAASISVLDRGTGVAPTDRERIFAPFEQGGDSLTGKPTGTGIGLHEAATIARQHGGRIEHIPRPGGGSEFRITVPLDPPPAEQAALAVGA